MADKDQFPKFAIPGSELPRNEIFKFLRSEWLERNQSTCHDLAVKLNDIAGNRLRILPQHVSQWASGSDNRRPPWWVMMHMAWWLGLRVVVEPNVVRIENMPFEVDCD